MVSLQGDSGPFMRRSSHSRGYLSASILRLRFLSLGAHALLHIFRPFFTTSVSMKALPETPEQIFCFLASRQITSREPPDNVA